MSRIKELQKQVDKTLDADHKFKQAAHLHGVALSAALIAKKRGVDPELAAMAGLLHDLYAYKVGSYDDHAHLGADYARTVLEKLELTTQEETEIICTAIWNHDNKTETSAPMDEVLKDADVLDHTFSDPTKEVKEHERERYIKLCGEFGLGWTSITDLCYPSM